MINIQIKNRPLDNPQRTENIFLWSQENVHCFHVKNAFAFGSTMDLESNLPKKSVILPIQRMKCCIHFDVKMMLRKKRLEINWFHAKNPNWDKTDSSMKCFLIIFTQKEPMELDW